MKSLFPDICSTNLVDSKEFYVDFLGFNVIFEIDWYIQLQSPSLEPIQIAFVEKNHSSVPKGYQKTPQGVVVTVEVENVDVVYQRAQDLGLPVIVNLCNEQWGQRHFMLEDPNGLLVDIYTMIEPTDEFAQQYGLA
ncbi:VOC family protein [Sessilibacter corallicola]|uniref:VOC family protein n=1 Tax=Sessilibacter corallicola TaxID=2904075 RepID=UPI001E57277C|nr:VOC family protein [Sessilibacter corallicola]